MDSLTKSMESTRLSDEPEEPEQLLFRPQPDIGVDNAALDNIPRFLFRLATPKSAGITNERWVRPESVRQNRNSSMEDVFFNLNDEKRTKVARILNSHLRWLQSHNPEDNFVSWTSSLLFAIQYIYYRHYGDGTSLAEIKLYVVDTMKFPRGTFMRDMDLIDIFCGFDQSLKNLQSLRNRPDYYFGEYLSQGSLKIEDKCQVIPAEVLFQQNRLRRIQPKFARLFRGRWEKKPKWVREVNRLRNAIWPPSGSSSLSPTGMGGRMQAIQEIVQNLAPDWKFPIAIYFAALIGPETSKEGQETANDVSRSGSFPNLQVPDEFQPWNFRVVAPDTIPELKQVRYLVWEVHRYTIFQDLLGRCIVNGIFHPFYPRLYQSPDILEDTEAGNHNLHVESDSSEDGTASVTVDARTMRHAQRIERSLSKVCMALVQMLCQEMALVSSLEEDS